MILVYRYQVKSLNGLLNKQSRTAVSSMIAISTLH
ncbi:hypothetical protein EMIT0111MI5_20144 [Burkholderia sp. IT-111MI5]